MILFWFVFLKKVQEQILRAFCLQFPLQFTFHSLADCLRSVPGFPLQILKQQKARQRDLSLVLELQL